MAVCKSVILLFAVVFAVVFATEESKAKRDVIVGAIPTMHHATPIMHYDPHPSIHYTAPYAAFPLHARTIAIPAYDDGKYFPGKYEKPTFYTAFSHVLAV